MNGQTMIVTDGNDSLIALNVTSAILSNGFVNQFLFSAQIRVVHLVLLQTLKQMICNKSQKRQQVPS